MTVKRWIAIPAGGAAVYLMPVDPPSCGPDVFVKLADHDAVASRLALLEQTDDNARAEHELRLKAEARLAEAERLLAFINNLTAESRGVCGFHLNGDATAARLPPCDCSSQRSALGQGGEVVPAGSTCGDTREGVARAEVVATPGTPGGGA